MAFQTDEDTKKLQLVRVAMTVVRSFGEQLEEIGIDTQPLVDYVSENQGIDGLTDEEKSTALTISGAHDEAEGEQPGVAKRVATAARNLAKKK